MPSDRTLEEGAAVREVTLYLGDVHAAYEPTLVKTLLGSCVSVCLYDPMRRIGGMNHFMLPQGRGDDGASPRFGVPAMENMIAALIELGGSPRRFVAKVFGGAQMLDLEEPLAGVPQQNIAFAKAFLAAGDIPIVGEDVGGSTARNVHFHSDTGRVFIKRASLERASHGAVALF
jgi:chemotaxis receptor (MCP) glutamine deamidase CheD